MASFKNIWVGYVDRSFNLIKDRLLTKITTKVPEITDTNETNIFIRILYIWAGLAEQLNYYIDNWARESYVTTCRLYESIVKLAKQFDYKIKSSFYSSADITFYSSIVVPSDIIIPQGTRISSTENTDLIYMTTVSSILATGETEITIPAIQAELITGIILGDSTGLADQTFVLPQGVSQGSVSLKVEGDLWEYVSTLAFSKPTDKHFTTNVNENREPILEFGNGVSGKIPDSGSELVIDYLYTLGETGNEALPETLTVLEDSLTLPIGITVLVKNKYQSSGGSGIETLDQIKSRIPLMLKTTGIARGEDDFSDIAKLASGVLNCASEFDCGALATLYITPLGGGLASEALCQSVVVFFEDKKPFSTTVQCYPAGELLLYLKVKITANKNAFNTVVKNTIITNLTDTISWEKQEIKQGINISDIYEIIENTEGVRNSNILEAQIVPFARPVDSFKVLNWNKTIKNTGSTTIKWLLRYNGSQFILFKDNRFIKFCTIGDLQSFDEIDFQILTGDYDNNAEYVFYTYPSLFPNKDLVDISEYSIIVCLEGTLNIEVTGGI